MDGATNIAGGAMAAFQMQPVSGPRMEGRGMAAIDSAAKEFESVFISQFLGAMFSGIKSDGIGMGGQGEEMFRSLLVDQYAKGLQDKGGFGLATQVKAQMLKMQEAHNAEAS